jgi:hypothetical protein
LRLLFIWGVREKAAPTGATVIYMEVDKMDGSARAIFNGREVNFGCFDAPTTGLLGIPFFVRMAANALAPWYFAVDLRYWFYPICLPRHLRDLFVVHVVDADGVTQKYRLRCLPMGFKWSPFIAQCIVWRLILSTAAWWLRIDPHNGEGESPPAFAHFYYINPRAQGAHRWKGKDIRSHPEVQTGVVAWYDNIIAWCSGEEGLKNLGGRLDATAKEWRMTWKNDADCVSSIRPIPLTALGMVWEWRQHAPSIGVPGLLFQISCDPKSTTIWKQHPTLGPISAITNRDVAGLVDIIIWAFSIR